MMSTLIIMYIRWVKLLLVFGGQKTVIGIVLWPTVTFTGELLTISIGWVEMKCYLKIQFYGK